jgi:hypothetical protein
MSVHSLLGVCMSFLIFVSVCLMSFACVQVPYHLSTLLGAFVT